MTQEEIKTLTEKMKAKNATPEEQLAFLKQLNIAVSAFRELVKQAHIDILKQSITTNTVNE